MNEVVASSRLDLLASYDSDCFILMWILRSCSPIRQISHAYIHQSIYGIIEPHTAQTPHSFLFILARPKIHTPTTTLFTTDFRSGAWKRLGQMGIRKSPAFPPNPFLPGAEAAKLSGYTSLQFSQNHFSFLIFLQIQPVKMQVKLLK